MEGTPDKPIQWNRVKSMLSSMWGSVVWLKMIKQIIAFYYLQVWQVTTSVTKY